MSGDPYILENERLEAEIARLQRHRELDRIDRERLQKCLSDRIARLQRSKDEWIKQAAEMEAQRDRLRAALEPFASLIVPKDTNPDEIQHFGLPASYFLAAQVVLAKGGK